MPTRLRSLNRFAVALALVGAFVGARAGVQVLAATVTFDVQPDLRFSLGQAVTVAFAAHTFTTSVTCKTYVTIPDDPNITFGSTTGCAVNWRTGEVWATNFDDIYPALNVITRHSGSNPLPYTDPARRLSTERYGSGNVLTPFPGNMN